MSELTWRKSSHSEASGNACIEIAENGHLIAVRDSKDPQSPWASIGCEAWARFTGALTEGRFH